MAATISENIKQLLHHNNLNTSRLAREVKIAQPVVHRLLTGKHQNPTLSTIKPIADFFNITTSQLIGEEKLCIDSNNKRRNKQIPLIASSQAAEISNKDIYDDCDEYMTTDAEISDKAFALKIDHSGLEPRFAKGSRVVIETTREPQDGDYVLVQTSEENAPHIQQIISDGSRFFFKSINPALQNMSMTEINDKNNILGVVAQVISYC